MKKFLSILAILTVCLTFTACRGEKNRFEGLKLVKSDKYFISLANSLEDLESYSDLIVIGEFIGDSEHCCERYSDNGALTEVVSSCPMKITKVLSGDAKVGDVVDVFQKEGIYNDTFISDSELTPMQNGDEWLFCLSRSSEERLPDGYWCVSDYKGRYPTSNSGSNEIICFSDRPELGVYNEEFFQEDLYNELVEKYGI